MSIPVEPPFRNQKVVAVGLIQRTAHELIVVRRTNTPPDKYFSFIGELALPGGWVMEGEQWREALAREIWEEAHVAVSTDPRFMHTFDAESTPNGKILLLFAKIIPAGVLRIEEFTPTDETIERHFVQVDRNHTTSLGIPLHQAAVEKYREQAFATHRT